MARLLIAAGYGVVWIGVTLRDVPMPPTVAVAGWDRGVVGAIAVAVAVVVDISIGVGCSCGEDCGGEVGWGEGRSGVRDLRRDR